MHFTGVVGTSAWAGVYVTQVCFYTNIHICDTLAAGCAHMCIYIYACICMYMHTDAYVRLYTLGRCYSDFRSVHTCAYACVCMCVHVCVYRCMCICMYMYICMSVYMYAYTFMYARVWVYTCTRVGAFCLFVLSNLSTTCACITGVS